jgi:hypothetical protein
MTAIELIKLLQEVPPDTIICVHAQNEYTDNEVNDITVAAPVLVSRYSIDDGKSKMLNKTGDIPAILIQ